MRVFGLLLMGASAALAQPGARVRTAFLTADGRCIEVAVPSDESVNPLSPR